jgi:GNAT superfamily N-acetyltransferase
MGELTVKVIDPQGPDAVVLIAHLDEDLNRRYGELQRQYAAANALPDHTTLLAAYVDGKPVACGALRRMDAAAAEVKRMWVEPEYRRRGIARRLLAELEERARQAGYAVTRLETGVRQHEAIPLYASTGYRRIDNYGTYVNNPESVCFEKAL